MNNIDRTVITVYVVMLIIIIAIGCGTCIYKLEELDKKIDNLNKLRQDSSLIEVNGELINEDNYYQAYWKSYTLAKDSIE